MNPGASHTEEMADEDVVRVVLDGDTEAFSVLMDRYKNRVFAIVGRHVPYEDVEETAQEVFIRVFESLAGFSGTGTFKAWLSTITVRSCRDFWRKRYRSREIPMAGLSEKRRNWLNQAMADQSKTSWGSLARRHEAREVLDWALAQMSADDRMVLELVHLEERSVAEVAEVLNISRANVKVRAFRSRKKLHKLLKQAGEEP